MTIKEALLSLNLVDDNKYLAKYITLIKLNRDTLKDPIKTQKHHIIPRYYYKINQLKLDNTAKNIVNLLYKDHILAHYYLALCAKDRRFELGCGLAIKYIVGNAKKHLPISEIVLLKVLPEYQKAYEKCKKSKPSLGTHHTTSQETRKKISKSNSGRVYINKNGIVCAVYKEDLEQYLADGGFKGNPNCQKRNTHKNSTAINNGTDEKIILVEELDMYLANGGIRGRTKKHAKTTSIAMKKYFDSLTSEERSKQCASYGMLGKHHTDNWRKNQSNKLKGRKASESQKIKNGLAHKGRIGICNDKLQKTRMIYPEQWAEFLQQGGILGRKIYK